MTGPEPLASILPRVLSRIGVAQFHTNAHIQAMKKPPETISFPEACRMLKKSREQVMRLIYRGELEAEQEDNQRWRITRRSVEAITHAR